MAKIGKQTDQKWLEQRLAMLEQASKLPPGEKREDLLRKARQLETACHINEWISSPGLAAPK